MPSLNVTVAHEIGQQEATTRLNGFAASLRERYKDSIKDLEETVEGNRGKFSFKTMGLKVAGTILIEEALVTVAMELPIAAMLFKGRIEKEVREQLERKLAK
ncbi:MAG: polyhydroxyalkanoic acid system family protein [Planctomycetia bacterium]|nr:polyhydroxyalkanoic acid system family protein [Planctomycetia bacterium]